MPLKFSASSAERAMTCPGSMNLELAIPGWTPPVVDPTAGMKGAGTEFHRQMEYAATLAPREMRWLGEAIAYVAELRQGRRFKMLTEHTVIADWLPSTPSTTVDVVLYTQSQLHVIDYKWGAVPVGVEDNRQLLFYAASLLDLAPRATTVTLHIVQPRASNMVSCEVSVKEILKFVLEARKADALIQAKNLTLVPSDGGCKFCPAFPHSRGDKGSPLCPAALSVLYPVPFDEDDILNLEVP